MKLLQDHDEFAEYLRLLTRAQVKSYLEIGSYHGASLLAVSQILPPGARIVAVDKAESRKNQVLVNGVADLLTVRGFDVHLFWGDSSNHDIIAKVNRLAPFDAVFIDGDHSLRGVTSDWENYGPMGKIIAFHDISWSRDPGWPKGQIEVPELWEKLKEEYSHKEIRMCPTKRNNGIGVLWR